MERTYRFPRPRHGQWDHDAAFTVLLYDFHDRNDGTRWTPVAAYEDPAGRLVVRCVPRAPLDRRGNPILGALSAQRLPLPGVS